MLSVHSIAAADTQGLANSYGDLSREDYYTAGGEPPGQWLGRGAEGFGLAGDVRKGELFHTRDLAPRIHNLVRLAEIAEIDLTPTVSGGSAYVPKSSLGDVSLVNESIAIIVRKYLKILQQQDIQVSYGVIFGSQARGEAGQWSDIDLLVVSPRYDKTLKRADINLLCRVAARTDSRIEPIPVGQQQFLTDDSSAIIEIARREGQVIHL